ncbi:MAG TPA: hypothetical protein VJH97_03355 [Candidatus Nanoarchaeia archaeon]|nr:hypothetical protein [Candidatus Nanoarchaeia archaeon]
MNKSVYLVVSILTIGLVAYDNFDRIADPRQRTYLDLYLDNPALYGGHKWGSWGTIVNQSDDHFYLFMQGHTIRVQGSVQPAIWGETNYYLYFGEDGTISLIDYHNQDYFYLYYLLSFIGFLIFLWIFFKEWKLTKRGFENA